MNFLRKIVSGKRNRYQNQKYDLDITYVTKRVAGMSFPASGFELVYRNNINDVAAFLEERHKDAYLIFNLSCRKYDYRKFKNMVREYRWEDHHSPAMNVLFEVCQEMYQFLKRNIDNIVIVNCNAGKGRTGTSIACFLMFSGLAENAQDAITYYGWQRFEHGRGVTQPSQVRYIHYFEGIYKRMIQSPCIKILEKIVITTVPRTSNEGCTPFIEVLSGKDFDLIWTNKNSQNLRNYKNTGSRDDKDQKSSRGSESKVQQKIVINVDNDPLLCGDIYFRLMHKGSLKNKLICRFALNTSFIQNNMYEFTKQTVDPDSIIKDHRISWDFKIECYFKDFCNKCASSMPIDSLCKRCTSNMTDEVQSWRIIKNILDKHPYPQYQEGVFLNYNSNQCDFQEIIKKKIPINCEEMQYFQEEQQSDSEYDDEENLEDKINSQSTMQQTYFTKQQTNGSSSGVEYEEFKKVDMERVMNSNNKSVLLAVREVVSDTEEESYGKMTITRKVEMLNVNDADEEFEVKTNCRRRKSLDFDRERNTAQAKKSFQSKFDVEEQFQGKQTIKIKKTVRKISIQHNYFE